MAIAKFGGEAEKKRKRSLLSEKRCCPTRSRANARASLDNQCPPKANTAASRTSGRLGHSPVTAPELVLAPRLHRRFPAQTQYATAYCVRSLGTDF